MKTSSMTSCKRLVVSVRPAYHGVRQWLYRNDLSLVGSPQLGSRTVMAGRHSPMLSFSMRMLWLKVSYAVVLISISSRVLGSVSYAALKMEQNRLAAYRFFGICFKRPPVSCTCHTNIRFFTILCSSPLSLVAYCRNSSVLRILCGS